MSTAFKDAAGTVRYNKSSGEGTTGDPYITEYKETSASAILAALTAMNGYVDGLEAAITTLTGHQDGVEGLIGTTNTTLTTLAGYVDTLETLIAATNTALSTLGGYQDGVETLLGTTNTNLTTLAGHVDGLEALVTLLNGYIDGLESLTGALTETVPASDTASSGLNGRLQRIAQRLTSLIALIPASLGQKTAANSLAVTLASDQSNVPTKELRSATATLSNVASSASTGTILASNANRLGATITNDSTAYLYLKLGATASLTSYTAKLYPDDYYEIPFGYTGIIDGIWSAANGNARVTELT